MIGSPRGSDWRAGALVLATGVALAACGGGSSGSTGPSGPPGPPGGGPIAVGLFDPLPGVVVEIVGVTGGSGASGAVRPGDVLTVQFTAETNGRRPARRPRSRERRHLSRGSFEQLPARARAAVRRRHPRRLGRRGGLVLHVRRADPGDLPCAAQRHDRVRHRGRGAQGTAAPRRHVHGRPRALVGVHARRDRVASTRARASSDLLFGSARRAARTGRSSQNQNCNVCHTELRAHDGRRKDVRTVRALPHGGRRGRQRRGTRRRA